MRVVPSNSRAGATTEPRLRRSGFFTCDGK
jgi:hypothetical protein